MSKLVATLCLSVGVGLVVVGLITTGHAFFRDTEYVSTGPWPFTGN